jgi:hypothetical protein
MKGTKPRSLLVALAAVFVVNALASTSLAQSALPQQLAQDQVHLSHPIEPTTRCVALELYTRAKDEALSSEVAAIRKAVGYRRGVRLKTYDLDSDPRARERLDKIAKAYKLKRLDLPIVYGMNVAESGGGDQHSWNSRLNNLLRIEVFTRTGCSRCERAKKYLPSFRAKYPGLQVVLREVVADPAANERFRQLARSQRIGGISFPGFSICGQLIIGFEHEDVTGGRIDATLKRWTFPCEFPTKVVQAQVTPKQCSTVLAMPQRAMLTGAALLIANSEVVVAAPVSQDISATSSEPVAATESMPPLELENEVNTSDDLPIPPSAAEPDGDVGEVEVPFFGKLSVLKLGMPLFTFLIGLVDGFNPCAMWVLLFLLSVLVNLQDRWKILTVAGTFVLVSGIAYFAFMAAWLNVMYFVGYLRWVQITLALLAVLVGLVHIKDFFAFRKGVSLSIPESSKPGIYRRVRGIVTAESVLAAIAGATVLAVLVNIVELLCTAGLPALYSQVLVLQDFPRWKNYAYLALYILAYMLDDLLMVTIVVVTLGKWKLQERGGRWLKLVSGVVILVLGLVLLVKPEWLG